MATPLLLVVGSLLSMTQSVPVPGITVVDGGVGIQNTATVVVERRGNKHIDPAAGSKGAVGFNTVIVNPTLAPLVAKVADCVRAMRYGAAPAVSRLRARNNAICQRGTSTLGAKVAFVVPKEIPSWRS